jgi:hypothetical protein
MRPHVTPRPSLARSGSVDPEPVAADLAQHLGQHLPVERLDDVAVDARLITVGHIARLRGGGKDDDGDRTGARIGFEASQHVQPGHARQLQVE